MITVVLLTAQIDEELFQLAVDDIFEDAGVTVDGNLTYTQVRPAGLMNTQPRLCLYMQ